MGQIGVRTFLSLNPNNSQGRKSATEAIDRIVSPVERYRA